MKTILIADDSPHKIEMLCSILEHLHWKGDLLTANTTDQAKQLIAHFDRLDAAFIDYNIPTEDGPALIRHIKHLMPTTPITLFTATDSSRYEADARAAGAEAFVCTSWQADAVEKAVKNFLEL